MLKLPHEDFVHKGRQVACISEHYGESRIREDVTRPLVLEVFAQPNFVHLVLDEPLGHADTLPSG
jgi:hypothetical protein